MNLKKLTSLLLVAMAFNAGCSKESAPAASDTAAAPAAPTASAAPAPAVASASAPTTSAPATAPAMTPATPAAPTVAVTMPVKAAPATSATTTTDTTAIRSNLDTAITEAVRVLDAKDYGSFIKEFAPPDALPPGMPPGMIDQILPMIVQQPDFVKQMGDLDSALKAIGTQKIAPAMSDDGKTATYNTTAADGSKSTLLFKKNADGTWYPDMP